MTPSSKKGPSVTSWFMGLVFRRSERLPAADFDLRVTLPDARERARIHERVTRALEVVGAYAPVRYAALRRDLPRILVGPADGLGECHADVGLVVLQFNYVVADATTPEELALALVHEGMHARLGRAGFAYTEQYRARIERICLRTELLVAKRIPGGDQAAERARRLLAWPDAMWTNDAVRARVRRRLESLGWTGKLGAWLGAMVARWRSGGEAGAA